MSTPADRIPPEPSWLRWRSANPVLRGVLGELLGQERFRAHADSAVAAPPGGREFSVAVGDQGMLQALRQRMRPGVVGLSLFNESEPERQETAGISIDVDELHRLVGQDSARARELVRDALVHEFAHVLPVARSRSLQARLLDPQPGQLVADAPILGGENQLRGILGLPAKGHYGLLSP